MQIKILDETSLVEAHGWIARVRPPTQPWNNRVVLLLHGWTGDENIMWIFARKLPANCWMLAPRGPLNSPDGGYAWGIPEDGKRPDISRFLANADGLMQRMPDWVPDFSSVTRLDIIGFSQGAAMTYAMCLNASPVKVAPLAGYLPLGMSDLIKDRDFSGLNMYISHNIDDDIVPVDESRKAVDLFSSRGAIVKYDEKTGGHKLSAAGFNGLNNFLKD